MHAHAHVPHWPHPHVPHVDLRTIGRDAVVAAEVAVAALLLGAAVDGRRLLGTPDTDPVAGPAAGAPAAVAIAGAVAAAVVIPTIEVHPTAAGVAAHVRLPIGATATVALVDAAGTVVAETVLTGSGVVWSPTVTGAATLVLHVEGPVETTGDVAVSSAVVLRSGAFAMVPGGTVTVRIDP